MYDFLSQDVNQQQKPNGQMPQMLGQETVRTFDIADLVTVKVTPVTVIAGLILVGFAGYGAYALVK